MERFSEEKIACFSKVIYDWIFDKDRNEPQLRNNAIRLIAAGLRPIKFKTNEVGTITSAYAECIPAKLASSLQSQITSEHPPRPEVIRAAKYILSRLASEECRNGIVITIVIADILETYTRSIPDELFEEMNSGFFKRTNKTLSGTII